MPHTHTHNISIIYRHWLGYMDREEGVRNRKGAEATEGVRGSGFHFRFALWDKSSLMSWQREMGGSEELWELGLREQGSEEEERGRPRMEEEGKWLWNLGVSCQFFQAWYVMRRRSDEEDRGRNLFSLCPCVYMYLYYSTVWRQNSNSKYHKCENFSANTGFG